ncbi:hypothetical protein MYU51_010827 [Penicillium brevicompactum]|uniref:uncharacterized protein n=1 Tax=Penicillium brevicompactum TaxID=5074 RepID=UPI0025400CD3|nr:uncharacterized protein N7506_001582 [Penicillium brevicompactum]KAJ5348329.1 hypothetical protein N7506_001582 [Penicillium brevicompactum]
MVKPTLEGLPTELLILILNEIPDHSSLKSIVLSAPTIYQAYLTARPEILRRMITNLFGPLLGEAILAIRSRDLLFADHKEEAIALLDTWRRKDEIKKRTSSNLRCIDVVDNLQETFRLFRFHNQLEFFLADYAKHAPRPAWIPENDWESSFTPIELSPTEKHRFLRAMCRLQTHGNIFGPAETVPPEHGYCIQKTNDWNSYEPEDTYDDRMLEAYRLFFGAMPPWEYSEMGCIWSYLLPKFPAFYDDIIQSMREIVESSPTSQPGLEGDFEFLPPDIRPPMNPCVESLDGLEGLFSLEQSTKSLAELGPDFLFRILHTSPLSRRDMILTNIHSRVDSFIGIDLYVLYSDEEAIVPLISPADKHSTKNYEELWSHLPSTETPNKAWKKQHLVPDFQGQTFEDALSGMNTEDNWDWGFALWDDERLEAWQALIQCES